MSGSSDFQVLYSNGPPASPIRLGQLLVDESVAAPLSTLKICTSLSPVTYTSVIGGTGAGVPSTRTLTAGLGLTGGGDLSADRTFDVGAGTGITVNTNDVAIANTAVTPASYIVSNVTVDQQGRLTAASSGSAFAQSTAQQSGFAVDTTLTGSSVTVPAAGPKVGTRYHLVFDVTKTAAGTAAPIIRIRFNGTIRNTLTFSVQTAAIDAGIFEVWVTFRVVGASAVAQAVGRLTHGLSITGLGTLVSDTQLSTSAAFDFSVPSTIHASVNGGTSAAWTIELVQAEVSNLA